MFNQTRGILREESMPQDHQPPSAELPADSILFFMSEPAFVVDGNFIVRQMNAAALKLFNLQHLPPRQLCIDFFQDVGMSEEQLVMLKDKATKQEPVEIEVYGQHFVLHTTMYNDDGWRVTILHDVSDFKTREDFQKNLIQIAAHDLKNPLNIIAGLASIMQMEVEGEYREWVDQMLRNTQRMENIINNILSLERANAGYLQLDPVDPCYFIDQIVKDFQHQIADKSQTLVKNIPPCNVFVNIDYNQLFEAISNLMSNAVKYTPEGGTVTLTLEEQRDHIRIMVEDTGIGIPEKAMTKLFEPFYRVRASSTEGIPGTGLGLSIAKSVVEGHGGEIWVESTEGQGTTFFVALPIIEP